MTSAAISSWKLDDTSITSYFLLKLLNRHHPEWTHGEDIRSLTKVPEAKWISEGKGFSSKIYSIKLTVEDKVYQFCVKIPSIFHLESSITSDAENEANIEDQKFEAQQVIAQTHARELAFYIMATVYFKNLKIPKFIYGREWTNDQEGLLMMEDFTNRCEPTFCAQKSFTHEQILALIDQIVILQASSMKIQSLENDFQLLSNTVKKKISRYANLSIEILLTRNLEFFTENIADKLRDLAHPEMLEQILVRCDDLFPVLVHSAIWPGNVLWSSSDNSKLLSIIDWQGCFVGSPTADLAALLAISVSAKERQKREDEYLQYYVQKFNELQNDEKVGPLEFETVKESYGRSLLYSMIELMVVIISNPMDDVIEESESYGVMTKRLKALIEDLLLE